MVLQELQEQMVPQVLQDLLVLQGHLAHQVHLALQEMALRALQVSQVLTELQVLLE
jgi:hypothetical protein